MEFQGYGSQGGFGSWTCFSCGTFVYDGQEHICPITNPVTINIPFESGSQIWPPLVPTLEERIDVLENKLDEIIKLLRRIK